MSKYFLALAALSTLTLTSAAHAAFIDGDIAILQVNANSSTTNAAALTLNIYNTSGGLVSSVAIPSSGALAATLESTPDNHDGHLNLSSDGSTLVFAAYRANVGASDPSAASATSVNRVIVTVDSNFNVNTSTALSDAYDHSTITAVASVDGKEFWTVGSGSYVDSGTGNTVLTTSGGLRYVSGVGATTSTNLSQTQVTNGTNQPDSYRSLRLQGGQLILSTASQSSFSNNRGAFTTGTTLPTSGSQSIVPITTLLTSAGTSASNGTSLTDKTSPKSDIIYLDLNPAIPGYDTAYSTGGKADLEKWALLSDGKGGYVWTQESVSTFSTSISGGSTELEALEAVVTGNAVTLYGTTINGVYKLTDTAGYGTAISSNFSTTPFILADSSTQFRGIAILGQTDSTTVPEPTTLASLGMGAFGLLLRRRKNAAKVLNLK